MSASTPSRRISRGVRSAGRSISGSRDADGILLTVDTTVDQFAALQAKLIPLWQSIRTMNQDPQTIVIVPSMNVDAAMTSVRQQALEERFLFLLLLLRQPRARVIYITSQQIHPDVLEYYLDLLPGVFAGHARKRLFAVSPLDGSTQPLTKKL